MKLRMISLMSGNAGAASGPPGSCAAALVWLSGAMVASITGRPHRFLSRVCACRKIAVCAYSSVRPCVMHAAATIAPSAYQAWNRKCTSAVHLHLQLPKVSVTVLDQDALVQPSGLCKCRQAIPLCSIFGSGRSAMACVSCQPAPVHRQC